VQSFFDGLRKDAADVADAAGAKPAMGDDAA